ncbi:MAG: flagellar hook assembly protein FlgD [Rubrivivax sp.]|nr:flagellar hook assembly protein FlgD [Rubrivivax sp.]
MNLTASQTAASAADPFAGLNGKASVGVTQNDTASADRFLKLLVAQMQNQDPLNPMDNAQVTSQMAQINTVDGISKLNETVKGLNGQFVQLQALQGASLVGRVVSVPGDRLALSGAEGARVGEGGFELTGTADNVRVEILTGAGRVIGSQDLGALDAGRHHFEWPAGAQAAEDGLRYRVVATRGAATVAASPLMLDRVSSVSIEGNKLRLELERSGSVDYGSVAAVH